MPSCIRLGQAETLLTCTLLLLIGACTPTQAQIKPVSLVPEVRMDHQSKPQSQTQAIFKQEPELTYLARYPTFEVGAHSKRPNLTAAGLGHSQAKALCRRLKRLKV
jgi:hypothetical protein|tara:strand:+ start:39 stop:356 length:318 start_codon:yes stop_codon:yes gene_type:complete